MEMERIQEAQPPPKYQQAELSDMQGMDFPIYVYKSRRGMKRAEECKENYKLPHRLIEKKRRDRINECIAQLKDLLPEHLKLTTLGHLEKAVVLELTLKHVKALTTLLENQQQKILALQNGMQIEQSSPSQENSEGMFRSGFHVCAQEVLQYLANQEGDGDLTPSHMINHLHKVATEILQCPPHSPWPEKTPSYHHHQALREKPVGQPPKPSEGHRKNCVPVIQRAYAQVGGEQSGSDTDTDSGYGGEQGEHLALRAGYYGQERQLKRALGEKTTSLGVKQEDEPRHKHARVESSDDEFLSGGESSSSSSSPSSGHGSYMSAYSPHQAQPHPLCMPFYLIPPSAAAYLPMLEKCWYSGAMPMIYPGLGGSAQGMPSDTHAQTSLITISPRGHSPSPPTVAQSPMDSPALIQALKPINLETKD
ncbi:class E basic helix-loop-helix protein 40-like [Oncorhynchus nerka]|uniref:class E basic helix-loop-helix protein 40-like n=1 Tax=Oncorhynchus nerka TaxID=8023 RepID=UPI001130390F|nr:class E basic helix-loop-helix protein 40-like [Oncorhynchus nerka]